MNEPDQIEWWKGFREAVEQFLQSIRKIEADMSSTRRPPVGEQDEKKREKFPLTEGWYWVWHDNEWKPGHWDGEDWNIQGIITSRILPRGPGWIVPPKPTEPPEIPDAGMSSARRVPGGEQDDQKFRQDDLP